MSKPKDDFSESSYIHAFILGHFHVYLYANLRKLHSREIGASLSSLLGAQDAVAVLGCVDCLLVFAHVRKGMLWL